MHVCLLVSHVLHVKGDCHCCFTYQGMFHMLHRPTLLKLGRSTDDMVTNHVVNNGSSRNPNLHSLILQLKALELELVC
jgi:hypothetical protein